MKFSGSLRKNLLDCVKYLNSGDYKKLSIVVKSNFLSKPSLHQPLSPYQDTPAAVFQLLFQLAELNGS